MFCQLPYLWQLPLFIGSINFHHPLLSLCFYSIFPGAYYFLGYAKRILPEFSPRDEYKNDHAHTFSPCPKIDGLIFSCGFLQHHPTKIRWYIGVYSVSISPYLYFWTFFFFFLICEKKLFFLHWGWRDTEYTKSSFLPFVSIALLTGCKELHIPRYILFFSVSLGLFLGNDKKSSTFGALWDTILPFRICCLSVFFIFMSIFHSHYLIAARQFTVFFIFFRIDYLQEIAVVSPGNVRADFQSDIMTIGPVCEKF